MKKQTTALDIAKKLGFSKSVVSRALNDQPGVREEKRKLVKKTAAKMHYQRNQLAINLRMQSTRTIGIIVPESENLMFMKFINHAQKYLQLQDYRVALAQCGEDAKVERENLQMMMDCRVDGIIICACHNTRNLDKYREVLKAGIPMVFFDRTVDRLPVSKVKFDDNVRSCFMMEHLIRQGRRRIVHLAGPAYIQNSSERLRAYRDTLEKFAIPFSQVVPSGVSMEDGERAMEAFLRKQIPFDAVFCFTENVALGAKRCLQKHGIAIPREVAVCCVSGTDLSTWVYPTLTAIEQPLQPMAQNAVQLILEKLKHPDTPPKDVVLQAEMVVRESTVS